MIEENKDIGKVETTQLQKDLEVIIKDIGQLELNIGLLTNDKNMLVNTATVILGELNRRPTPAIVDENNINVGDVVSVAKVV